jgi:hypothetical protein
MRGDTASAAGPNTGDIRRFSVRNWITTTPLASWSGTGGSMMIFAGGCSASGTEAAGPSTTAPVVVTLYACGSFGINPVGETPTGSGHGP